MSKIKQMARHPNPESVSSKVAELELNGVIEFINPYTSVAVMISNLKKKEQHKEKVFKIKFSDDKTQVIRIR